MTQINNGSFSYSADLKDALQQLQTLEQEFAGQTDTSKMNPTDLQTMANLLQEINDDCTALQDGEGNYIDHAFMQQVNARNEVRFVENDIALNSVDKTFGDPTLLNATYTGNTNQLAQDIAIENQNGNFAALTTATNNLYNTIPGQ